MARFEEAMKRMYGRKYVCKKCKSSQRANPIKINEGEIKCRNCGFTCWRAPRKK